MDDLPQPIFDGNEEQLYSSDNDSTFMKKFMIFIGAELVVALIAVGIFIHIGASNQQQSLAMNEKDMMNPQGVQESDQKVLGADTTATDSHVVYKIVTPTPSPSDIPKNKSYRVAIVGDSLEDTMGETGEFLQKALKTKYPDTEFLIYNYGKGANKITDGMDSFSYNFQYGIRNYPSITDLKPDILILGSYANNVPDPYDRNWHWLTYTQLVQKALKVTPKVYILAEVAPLRDTYGDGPNGPNWDRDTALAYSAHVDELMGNVISLSKSLNVSLIDVFDATQVKGSKYDKAGDSKDISASDGIQPSLEGHELMANAIAQTIKLN